MTASKRQKKGPLEEVLTQTPHWLRLTGVYGWLFVGAAALIVGLFWIVTYTSDLTMPLGVALVFGMLFAPIVDWLHKRRIPRGIGATIVLIVLLAVIALTLGLVINGVIGQSKIIGDQVTAGVDSVVVWAQGLDLPPGTVDEAVARLTSALEDTGGAIATALTRGLSGTLTALSGLFLGAFMLFFMLKDWNAISAWVGCHLGVPADIGAGLLDDAVSAMREYFKSVTITGVIVAIIVGVAVAIIGLPLAVPIALVTWLTCYIPYVGALISAVFAVLVALGSGGLVSALIVLVVVLFAQNIVQTIIQNQLASERLNLHALALLIVTILGGIVGGLIGSMLAPALLAFGVRAYDRLKEARAAERLFTEEDGGPPSDSNDTGDPADGAGPTADPAPATNA